MLRTSPLLVAAILVAGCSTEGDGSSATSGGAGGSDGGLVLDLPCPEGEHLLIDGTCGAAGIPPDACATGFEPDGERGCRPVLPAAPCTNGEVALPGETACRPLGDCGTGTWGDIPVDATTVYVDQSFTGLSTGSATAPFTTVSQAITAAASGGLVAIAAGTYVERVAIGKPLHLWGRCPSMVTIDGDDPTLNTVEIVADGSTLHDLSVTGGFVGVAIAADASLERVDAYDNALAGAALQGDLGPATIAARDSLFRDNGAAGLAVAGELTVTLERNVFRGNLATSTGAGLSVEEHPTLGGTPEVVLRDSVSEANRASGISTAGGRLTVERSVIRGNAPIPSGGFGLGIQARIHPFSSLPSELTLRQSTIVDNDYSGVLVAGSGATIEDVTIRRTAPQQSDGERGHGLDVIDGDLVGLPTSVLRGALSDNHEIGISAASGSVVIRDSIVARTMPRPDTNTFGRGLNVQFNPTVGSGAVVELTASDVVANHEVGLAVVGATVLAHDVAISGTLPQVNGLLGRAVSAQATPDGHSSNVRIERSRLFDNAEGGVVVHGSGLEILETWIAGTSASENALYGDGVSVEAFGTPAVATLTRVRIEGNDRVGLASFGSMVTIQDVELLCNAIHLNGEDADTPFVVQDGGGNRCGCGESEETCKVLSAGLDPPSTVE